MADDHKKTLQTAREEAVRSRRQLASALAAPYDRQQTPQWRSQFVEVQNLIDAIDRAIAQESSLEPPEVVFL